MADKDDRFKGSPVPGDRLSRLARFGSLAVGVAGGMLADGARQVAQGHRPSVSDLLLTPANALRVTQQLSRLRGAAMKVGQLLSMDAGDILSPELAEIFASLRSDAQPMPHRQVQMVLAQRWGKDWQAMFQSFSLSPLAAASIGQVHRATTTDGRDLAVKIQYPGVRTSIDSDVDNIASLIRLSGMVPKTLDIGSLLSEAKRQLHAEADYGREGEYLARFGALLANQPDVAVPTFHADLSGRNVLAMSYVEGVPVESRIDAPQTERDRIATLMIDLVLRELFEFQLMQTDPNFANYLYDTANNRLVLLDFGATREFSADMAQNYRTLLKAGLEGDGQETLRLAGMLGFFDAGAPQQHREAVTTMFDMAMGPLRQTEPFDFATSDLVSRLRDSGMTLASERQFWHVPPTDLMFLQRKVAGVYLLASRLKARIAIAPLLAKYV